MKRKIQCYVLGIKEEESLKRFISVVGITAVVDVRKSLPSFCTRFNPNTNEIITGSVAVQLLDVINLVDVESNANLGPWQPNATFCFHGNGYKGIDLIFMPDVSSLRISIHYKCFIVQDALAKLNALGVGMDLQQNRQQHLTDEEIELLL